MKKILSLVGAGALLLSVAVPAFAVRGPRMNSGSEDVAIVTNSATANANTGWNEQGNVALVDGRGVGHVFVGGDNSIVTGDASAYAGALVVANTHIGCGSCVFGGQGHKDFALVGNSSVAGADTGDNSQGNAASVTGGLGASGLGGRGGRGGRGGSVVIVRGDNYVETGSADSTARAWTIVNTHIQ